MHRSLQRRVLTLALTFWTLSAFSQQVCAQANIGLPMAAPESVGMSSERLGRITKRMQEYIDQGNVAGTITLVARQGKVVHFEAQGYRDRETKAPMKQDDIFVIMSMTKPIASTALMMLYEDGKFLLNDPISKWLPEFKDMQVRVANDKDGTKLEPARPITFRHVLTHTAGLSTNRGGGARGAAAGGAAAPASDEPAQANIRTRVKRLAGSPLNFQPGTKWEYGSGTDVVAALAEVISGQNMDDFFRERIFKPLGMTDTYYNVPEAKRARRATAYAPQADGSIRANAPRNGAPTTVFGGVAGLSSTAADYFRFHQMMLNGGEYNGVRLLSPKTVDTMISNHIGDNVVALKGPGYGFGLGYSVIMDAGKANESLTPGSFGWGGAWGTYFFVDPTEEMLGILMIQITSYNHLNIRSDLTTLATQAIIQPKSSGTQKIRGYQVIE